MDTTETDRRERVNELNEAAGERATLEARYGKVWDTEQLRSEFTVSGFLAPFVSVTRTADGVSGSMEFQHNPRFYFNFRPTK